MEKPISRRRREMEILLHFVREGQGIRAPDRDPSADAEAPHPGGRSGPLQRDLTVPLSVRDGGLFSPAALLGTDRADYDFLEGRSLRDVILDPAVSLGAFRRLSDLGEFLGHPTFSPRLRVLGRALRFLSAVSALSHHSVPLPSLDVDDFRKDVSFLKRSGAFDPELHALCRRAGEILFTGIPRPGSSDKDDDR